MLDLAKLTTLKILLIIFILIAKNNNIHLIIERKIVSKSGVNSSLDSTLFQDLTGWDTEYDLRSILREEFDYQIGTQREN